MSLEVTVGAWSAVDRSLSEIERTASVRSWWHRTIARLNVKRLQRHTSYSSITRAPTRNTYHPMWTQRTNQSWTWAQIQTIWTTSDIQPCLMKTLSQLTSQMFQLSPIWCPLSFTNASNRVRLSAKEVFLQGVAGHAPQEIRDRPNTRCMEAKSSSERLNLKKGHLSAKALNLLNAAKSHLPAIYRSWLLIVVRAVKAQSSKSILFPNVQQNLTVRKDRQQV